MSSIFSLPAKNVSEVDLPQTRLDADRKNIEGLSVHHPSSQASIDSSGFIGSLEVRTDQPGAGLVDLKENREQAERIRMLEIQNAALIAARDAIRAERDAARHERQNIMQQKDEALRNQAEAEEQRDAARAEVARIQREANPHKIFWDHAHRPFR